MTQEKIKENGMTQEEIEKIIVDFIFKNGYQPKTIYLSPKQMLKLSSRYHIIDGVNEINDEVHTIKAIYSWRGSTKLVESDEDNLPRAE